MTQGARGKMPYGVVALMPQKIWVEAGEWVGRCLCGVTPGHLGLSSTLRLGGLQRRLQRGAGRWSVSTTESNLMRHDVDTLLQM